MLSAKYGFLCPPPPPPPLFFAVELDGIFFFCRNVLASKFLNDVHLALHPGTEKKKWVYVGSFD